MTHINQQNIKIHTVLHCVFVFACTDQLETDGMRLQALKLKIKTFQLGLENLGACRQKVNQIIKIIYSVNNAGGA